MFDTRPLARYNRSGFSGPREFRAAFLRREHDKKTDLYFSHRRRRRDRRADRRDRPDGRALSERGVHSGRDAGRRSRGNEKEENHEQRREELYKLVRDN